MADRMIKVEELALAVGVSVKTINNWYAFKKAEPDSELAKLLPNFEQKGSRGTRLWKLGDVWKVQQFKSNIISGRNGTMGKVTQKYVRKGA